MKAESGFTLTELLITMTIVAILVGIGVPSFRDVTTSNRMSTEVNGLLGDLEFARSEAIKEGQPVTVCATNDGATCLAGANTSWRTGWIVFSDVQGDQTVNAPPDIILRASRSFSGTDTFDAGTSAVTFNREGFKTLPAGTATLTLRDATNNQTWTRCLSITMAGMMTTQTHASAPGCI
jgi:type IV fimbrial biogenesis protein FimT